MTHQELNLSDLPKLTWAHRQLVLADALVAFVKEDVAPDSIIQQAQEHAGGARWYPVDGGHRVLIPYDGGEFDTSRFVVERGAWDHEHCDVCSTNIPAPTTCHTTSPGLPRILLCQTCYELYVARKLLRPRNVLTTIATMVLAIICSTSLMRWLRLSGYLGFAVTSIVIIVCLCIPDISSRIRKHKT